MKIFKKNGFTLIECLVAIVCDFVVMTLVMVFMNVCIHVVNIRCSQQDQLAILQLRQICATATDIEVENNSLKMIYEHEEIEISFDRNRIVRSPGYEILIEDVEDVTFYEEEESIYLSYQKDKDIQTMQLT